MVIKNPLYSGFIEFENKRQKAMKRYLLVVM
jgi:hypothetical protein